MPHIQFLVGLNSADLLFEPPKNAEAIGMHRIGKCVNTQLRFTETVRQQWAAGLRRAFATLPVCGVDGTQWVMPALPSGETFCPRVTL